MQRILSLLNRFDGWQAIASAVLVCLAFPPVNLSLLVFVALVPWLQYLAACSPRQGWRSGLKFGWIFWLAQLHWFIPFVGRWTGSVWLVLVPWLLAPLLVVWFFGLVGLLMQAAFARRMVWFVPFAWAGVECLRAYFPGIAFPWGLLATPLWPFPWMIQTAAFGEIFLVSAWVVWANVIVWMIFTGAKPRQIAQAGLGFSIALACSIVRYAAPNSGQIVPITVGQTGVDMAFGRPDQAEHESRQNAIQIILNGAVQKSRFVVLPESVLNDPLPGIPPIPTLYGANRSADGKTYQSAYAIEGTRQTTVDKTRLVIFGEFVPFRSALPFGDAFKLPSGDLTAGSVVKPVDLAGVRIGPLLCFEGLFPDVARNMTAQRAQILAVMAVDDWYQGTGAIDQIAAGSVWRSVENGVPLVRSSSLGRSFATDSRGNMVTAAPYGKEVAMRVEVRIPERSDAFPLRWLFGWIALTVGLFPFASAKLKR